MDSGNCLAPSVSYYRCATRIDYGYSLEDYCDPKCDPDLPASVYCISISFPFTVIIVISAEHSLLRYRCPRQATYWHQITHPATHPSRGPFLRSPQRKLDIIRHYQERKAQLRYLTTYLTIVKAASIIT